MLLFFVKIYQAYKIGAEHHKNDTWAECINGKENGQ
jgi:hypothetical protein